MKKIITAMGNEVLNNELRRFSKYDVLCEDMVCQDFLISKLERSKADVIIVSGVLQGRWNLEEFIKKIKSKNSLSRIIIVIDEIEPAIKKILNDMGILDIFLDSSVEINDIIEAIDREETVRKKYEMINEKKVAYQIPLKDSSEEDIKRPEVIIEKAIQKQEIIAISGIPGSGKSTIAANICRILASKSDAKILLIDLDTLNGNIDELLKINKAPENIELVIDNDKKSGLNYAVELMLKNRFDTNVFSELVIECNGFDVLTGNTSLHYCQNVLKEEYYDKILSSAKEKYDFIVIDTSSNIFIDSTKWALTNANKIMFVTEDNSISIKKMEQFINVIVNIWGVFKGKIGFIVNKRYKQEIEIEAIEKIMQDIKCIGTIKQNEETNAASYENILSTIKFIPKKNILEKLFQIKKNLFVNSKMEKEVAASAN